MVNFERFEHINNLPKFKKDLLQMYSYTIFALFLFQSVYPLQRKKCSLATWHYICD